MPQVLINREPLPHLNFDVELLGDCDVIVNELCHRLDGDFKQLCYNSSVLNEIIEKPPLTAAHPEQACPEIQSFQVQATENVVMEKHGIVIEASDMVAKKSNVITDAPVKVNAAETCSGVQLKRECQDVEFNSSPSTAKKTRPQPEQENLYSISLKGTSPCPESSDACQSASTETEDCSPNAHHQTEEIMEKLETQIEEEAKHRSCNFEVLKKRHWLNQVRRSPISKRLGCKICLPFFSPFFM